MLAPWLRAVVAFGYQVACASAHHMHMRVTPATYANTASRMQLLISMVISPHGVTT
jgi:hypothetical protein